MKNIIFSCKRALVKHQVIYILLSLFIFSIALAFVSAQSSSSNGWTDSGSVVRLTTSTDTVGIGTTSPTAKLDVKGAIQSTNSPSKTINPTGNTFSTLTSLNLQATTGATKTREFLAHFGLTSNKGSSATGPARDKVAVYAATVGKSGTGDIWAMNPLITLESGSGSGYAAQGIEVDVNNFQGDRPDFANPVYGISITGAAPFKSTGALLISGNADQSPLWYRGIIFANNPVSDASIWELGNPVYSILIQGSPQFGIYQSTPTTNNYFAGNVGIGTPTPGEKLEVAGNIKSQGTTYGRLMFQSTGAGGRLWNWETDTSGKAILADLTALGQRIIVDTQGNVGVGTSNPTSKLHVIGKATITGGVDPPYISFSDESHESIRNFAKNVEEHEKAMQFWNGKTHRMEVYEISEDKFYTLNGEPIEE